MEAIILTKGQADKVRGKYGKYSALDPIAIDGEYFMPPKEVLKNKEFKVTIKELKKCESAVLRVYKVIDNKMPVEFKEVLKYEVICKEKIKAEWFNSEDI